MKYYMMALNHQVLLMVQPQPVKKTATAIFFVPGPIPTDEMYVESLPSIAQVMEHSVI